MSAIQKKFSIHKQDENFKEKITNFLLEEINFLVEIYNKKTSTYNQDKLKTAIDIFENILRIKKDYFFSARESDYILIVKFAYSILNLLKIN